MTEAPYSDLSEQSLAVLAHVHQVIADAKDAGRWAVEPIVDTDRFDGAIGADDRGSIATFRTLDDLQLAAVTRALEFRLPGFGRG